MPLWAVSLYPDDYTDVYKYLLERPLQKTCWIDPLESYLPHNLYGSWIYRC